MRSKSDLLQGKDAKRVAGISAYLLERGEERDVQTVEEIKASQGQGNSGKGC